MKEGAMCKTLKKTSLLLCVLAITSLSLRAQSQPAATAANDANALFQTQKWAEAAKAYETITKTDPANGRAWYRLGYALQQTGSYEQAVSAYLQAVEKLPPPVKGVAMYNAGTAYAKLNEKDKAFEWLTKALHAGFRQITTLTNDPDLATLRDDARFKELLVIGERLTKPCLYQEEHKQFDFWIGEWNVQNSQGQPVGTSSIQRIENGCIILENWTGGQGGSGKSLNFYDSSLHKWRQTWADSSGGVSEFAGEYKDGAIRFEGESHAPNGAKTIRRLTFFNLGPERVRQFSEASTDAGKTWTVDYDFTYVRKI